MLRVVIKIAVCVVLLNAANLAVTTARSSSAKQVLTSDGTLPPPWEDCCNLPSGV